MKFIRLTWVYEHSMTPIHEIVINPAHIIVLTPRGEKDGYGRKQSGTVVQLMGDRTFHVSEPIERVIIMAEDA